MPKKIPIIEKREWLRLFEAGDSEALIAHNHKRSLKTVKRGIEDARRERDAQLARSELLRDALRHHQDKMLSVIHGILGAAELPPADLQLQPRLILPGAKVEDTTKGLVLVLAVEDRPEWELVEEHLGKGDPLWTVVERWREAMLGHLKARINLREKVKTMLTSKTGLSLVDKPDNAPFLFAYSTIPLVYGETLNIALGNSPSKLDERITARTDTGEVRDGLSTILAKAPGGEVRCRDNILDAVMDLRVSDESTKVAQTYNALKEAVPKLRRSAEELALLGIIPGRCRICRRIGV